MSAASDATEQPGHGVAIVTDSTPYLPPELIERSRIEQVSLYVGWDGDLRAESSYVDLDAFYARLKTPRACRPPLSLRPVTSSRATSRW